MDEFEDLLPPAATRLREAVESVRHAVLAPFPDLDQQPTDDNQALGLIRQAIAWSVRVNEAVGSTASSSFATGRLLDEFGGLCFGVAEEWTGYNLLGKVPDHLNGLGLTWGFKDLEGKASVQDETAAQLRADRMERWGDVARNLRWAYLATRSKALQLCQWVEEQLAAYREALLPTIQIGKSVGRKVEVEVVLAGSRVQAAMIPEAQAGFLRRLADFKEVEEDRSIKSRLVANVPALNGVIERSGTPASKPESHSRYRLSAAMRGRISLKNNAEATRRSARKRKH